MIGLVKNSTIIGQGEDINLVFKIKDEQGIFQNEDTILFAMKDIDGNVKHTYSSLISALSEEDNIYTFIVEFSSELTLSLDIASYFYDVTLIHDTKKHTLFSPPRTIQIVKTVGASIQEENNDNNGGE